MKKVNVIETRIIDRKLCKLYKTAIIDGQDQNIPDQCQYMFKVLEFKFTASAVKNMRWELSMSLSGLGIAIHYEQETENTEDN